MMKTTKITRIALLTAVMSLMCSCLDDSQQPMQNQGNVPMQEESGTITAPAAPLMCQPGIVAQACTVRTGPLLGDVAPAMKDGLPCDRCALNGQPVVECDVAGTSTRHCVPSCDACRTVEVNPPRCNPDPVDLDLNNTACPGAPKKYAIPCARCQSVSRGKIVGCTMTVDLIATEGSTPVATPLFVCVNDCATDCPTE